MLRCITPQFLDCWRSGVSGYIRVGYRPDYCRNSLLAQSFRRLSSFTRACQGYDLFASIFDALHVTRHSTSVLSAYENGEMSMCAQERWSR